MFYAFTVDVEIPKEEPDEETEFVFVPGLFVGSAAVEVEPELEVFYFFCMVA